MSGEHSFLTLLSLKRPQILCLMDTYTIKTYTVEVKSSKFNAKLYSLILKKTVFYLFCNFDIQTPWFCSSYNHCIQLLNPLKKSPVYVKTVSLNKEHKKNKAKLLLPPQSQLLDWNKTFGRSLKSLKVSQSTELELHIKLSHLYSSRQKRY